MTYEILFSDTAFQQLKKLDRPVQERLIATFERIRIRPETHVTRLVGDQGYRLRVGEYRVIVDSDTGRLLILVLKVGYRKRIYK
jgi:mRNA interferase RelE/StbE